MSEPVESPRPPGQPWDEPWDEAWDEPWDEHRARALEATLADLRSLGAEPVALTPPPQVQARLEATLAALAAAPADLGAPAPPTDLAAARERRTERRRAPRRTGLLLAAAAVLGVLVLAGAVFSGSALTGADRTSGAATAARVDLGSSAQLGSTVLVALGRTDLGARLSDPGTLRGCLQANDVSAGTTVLGSAQVSLDGRPGTLLLLPTGTAGSFTALVVGPACSASDADRIVRREIGR